MSTDIVYNCARCGTTHEMVFKPFQRPSKYGHIEITHWGMCPNTDEPVIHAVRKRNDDEDEEVEAGAGRLVRRLLRGQGSVR